MKPLISVIVPCYNQAHYLDDCLQSVLDQSYINWECIIVNDGSPDNTEEVALKWQSIDSRFVYSKKENGGLCSARNHGISKATGKYILPLDSDDKIEKDYISKGIEIIDNNANVGVVYCKARFFGAVNKDWVTPEFDKKHLLCENLIFCSGIYRKQDWETIKGYDENMSYGWEDWEFWINLLLNQNKEVIKLNYLGFYYRQKDISMVTSLNQSDSKQLEMYNYIYNKHKAFYDTYFGHPITTFGELWKLQNKNRMLILAIKKIKAIFKK
ncbi:MAG: glycosyltransferase family A protein [Tissierellia bacterium]|nr:glycosyltransferase family A protein [Tissierellia bacterium]MDD4781043.1 glycosyltransferase family A protein [Tissierellia bacterium]